MRQAVRILGIDPGLLRTGWGVVDVAGSALSFVAGGVIRPDAKLDMAQRLEHIDAELTRLVTQFQPDEAAIEETFVNMNPASTLKLGMARGVAFVAPARAGVGVWEYATNLVKKSVVGAGHAGKDQVTAMVKVLLPTAQIDMADTADALAVAITHAHHRQLQRMGAA